MTAVEIEAFTAGAAAWLADNGAPRHEVDEGADIAWGQGEFSVSVFHDMGFMDFREETLEPVLTLTKPGGHIILDDVHKPPYRRFVHKMLADKGLEFLSLKQITCDSRARYSYLVFT